MLISVYLLFFFNDTATTEIYTLSLHDALPIFDLDVAVGVEERHLQVGVDAALAEEAVHRLHQRLRLLGGGEVAGDRKSTRLNSSHANISYAVFCLKKKTNYTILRTAWLHTSIL